MNAGFFAMLREQINRLPLPARPSPTWQRVRVTDQTTGFHYKARDGAMCIAEPGQIVEVEGDLLPMLRRLGRVELL